MSTVVIIGGTGYTGAHIAREAVARGHKVVSLSRSLPADPIEGVRYEQGAAADAAPLIQDARVVIGALSPRAGSQGTLVATYTSLATAAEAAGARLMVIGGFGSLRPAPGAPRFIDTVQDIPPEIAAEGSELNAVRAALEETPVGLNWAFISPAALYGPYLPGDSPAAPTGPAAASHCSTTTATPRSRAPTSPPPYSTRSTTTLTTAPSSTSPTDGRARAMDGRRSRRMNPADADRWDLAGLVLDI